MDSAAKLLKIGSRMSTLMRWMIVLVVVLLITASCGKKAPEEQLPAPDVSSQTEFSAIKPFRGQGTHLSGSTSVLYEFNPVDYREAKDDGRVILLYFYSGWDPLSKQEQQFLADALLAINDPNVVAFRVNYRDAQTNHFENTVAHEHGITYQHTKVVLIGNNRIASNAEPWDTARFVRELTR